MKGNDPKEIQILAVGTTDIPHHLTRYHAFLDSFYKSTEQYAAAYRNKGNNLHYLTRLDLLNF
jgi:hypothetical protein